MLCDRGRQLATQVTSSILSVAVVGCCRSHYCAKPHAHTTLHLARLTDEQSGYISHHKQSHSNQSTPCHEIVIPGSFPWDSRCGLVAFGPLQWENGPWAIVLGVLWAMTLVWLCGFQITGPASLDPSHDDRLATR